MPRPNLIIPVGIPGSGKSTWVREFLRDYFIISSDHIRVALFGSLEAAHRDEVKAENNAIVFETFHNWITHLLGTGKDVVADATNLNHQARQRLRGIAYQTDALCHIILFSNILEAQQRNARRTSLDRVPASAMAVMMEKYTDTLLRLPREQYDSVTVIKSYR